MRHNNKILVTLLLAAISFGSCSKFLDVNTDPNRPTDANITPELIFTQAELSAADATVVANYRFLDHWVGYTSANGTFALQQDEVAYNMDFSFSNPVFNNQMDVLFDLYQAKTKALATGNMGVAGASMILSAKLYQELVDLFGNIPYTQNFQPQVTTTPEYNDAKFIYDDLQLVLDSAIGYMQGDLSAAFGNADIIAHGDATLWIKFANTLKLRLLIRQSEVNGFSPASEIAKIEANGGVLGAGESISVNPGFVNDVNKQNPFYSNYGWSPTGVQATTADNANDYIVTLLGNYNDPRLGRFFYPVGFTSTTTYAGATYGSSSNPVGSSLSYFGPGLVGTLNASNQGDGTGAQKDMWIMPSFESMFFEAEAIARGWLPGNVEDAYNAAITESFVWLGVEDAVASADTYIAEPDINWSSVAGADLADQVDLIALEKYKAMTLIDPLEAYSDIRRLNMLPEGYISVYSGRLSDELPLRLLYPQSEYTTNGANVGKEGTIDPFTSKLFWEP